MLLFSQIKTKIKIPDKANFLFHFCSKSICSWNEKCSVACSQPAPYKCDIWIIIPELGVTNFSECLPFNLTGKTLQKTYFLPYKAVR